MDRVARMVSLINIQWVLGSRVDPWRYGYQGVTTPFSSLLSWYWRRLPPYPEHANTWKQHPWGRIIAWTAAGFRADTVGLFGLISYNDWTIFKINAINILRVTCGLIIKMFTSRQWSLWRSISFLIINFV